MAHPFDITMDLQALKRVLARPEVHEEILGGYEGWYSLGLGVDPKDRERHVVVLQVDDPQVLPGQFKSKIRLGDESLAVIVRNQVPIPRLLSAR